MTDRKKELVITNKINKMTEKEKCRQGLLYDANYDAELLSDRE